MTLELTEPARRLIAQRGFDPVYGARPLRRFIAHDVETRIARALVAGDLTEGSAIVVDAGDGEIVVEFRVAREPAEAGRR
jgi:ATP-dependent Clp protease ATP-binding subunit ClpB